MDIGLDADQSGRVIDPQRISASDIRDPAFRAFLRRPDISRWWWRKVIKLLEAAAPGSEERDEAEAKNLALRADGISAGNITNRFTNITARYESVAAQRTASIRSTFSTRVCVSLIRSSGTRSLSRRIPSAVGRT